MKGNLGKIWRKMLAKADIRFAGSETLVTDSAQLKELTLPKVEGKNLIGVLHQISTVYTATAAQNVVSGADLFTDSLKSLSIRFATNQKTNLINTQGIRSVHRLFCASNPSADALTNFSAAGSVIREGSIIIPCNTPSEVVYQAIQGAIAGSYAANVSRSTVHTIYGLYSEPDAAFPDNVLFYEADMSTGTNVELTTQAKGVAGAQVVGIIYHSPGTDFAYLTKADIHTPRGNYTIKAPALRSMFQALLEAFPVPANTAYIPMDGAYWPTSCSVLLTHSTTQTCSVVLVESVAPGTEGGQYPVSAASTVKGPSRPVDEAPPRASLPPPVFRSLIR